VRYEVHIHVERRGETVDVVLITSDGDYYKALPPGTEPKRLDP
jgi:hypothetical protein